MILVHGVSMVTCNQRYLSAAHTAFGNASNDSMPAAAMPRIERLGLNIFGAPDSKKVRCIIRPREVAMIRRGGEGVTLPRSSTHILVSFISADKIDYFHRTFR